MFFQDFIKVQAISPTLRIGDPLFNVKEMLKALKTTKASIVAFPKLSVTGYSCKDFFWHQSLYLKTIEAIEYFLKNNSFPGIVIIGSPFKIKENLYNTAFIIQKDKVLGIVPESAFQYQNRWFKNGLEVEDTVEFLKMEVPFGSAIFSSEALHFAIVFDDNLPNFSDVLSLKGANLIIHLSADYATWDHYFNRLSEIKALANKNKVAYLLVNASHGESTGEQVCLGQNIIGFNSEFYEAQEDLTVDLDLQKINYQRKDLKQDLFPEILVNEIKFDLPKTNNFTFEREFNKLPFVPKEKRAFDLIKEIIVKGLAQRLEASKLKKVIIGISGGLDSTLALLFCHSLFKKNPENIIAVTMPCFPTSEKSYQRALALAKTLKVTLKDIRLDEAVTEHFKLIAHDLNNTDIVYENTQARYRTLILMNLANKEQGLVIGTGDLSEIALGFSTYNGDQMSMYNLNAGITKTNARFLVSAYSELYPEIKKLLIEIVEAKVSPELKENQNTEDILGDYEINDFILYRFLSSNEEIKRTAFLVSKTFKLSLEEAEAFVNRFYQRFITSQFKRAASPDGPQVGQFSLSAKTAYLLPSDFRFLVK
ncbi:MAG: NAD(+) synthase [Erysipelotrichales bacterium]|nr:NAD(+) synthase [Erysipelotrichales bacterium]